MEIRRANLEDAGILSALNADVQRLHADALPHLFKQPEDDAFALQFMREQLSDPRSYFFIGSLDGEDIGYIFARVIDRPENPYTYAWHYVYIDQISVKPAYQNKGCGKLLIQEVVKLAAEVGADWVGLDTWSFNEQAITFFEKQGFSTFNQRMWLTRP
jgi:ribosomal protein S18 acetylase RimI-like enzyme